ncbi:YceI family protein [Flavobacterium aciduliphilum]|uniref:YceI-like domain-containing protein n=1 Tax=Flavobacterium aciduliphilum TaxID=1101402 RepID=A0A328YTU8_9FLAO|nr:YceI family protein [Flavobacterium aciduliphilum]RAR75632.1 YceI-like domain-containing protein [Flavobacterium aciduliphilum]
MKKTIVTLICLVFSSVLFSQKVMTRSGEIKFDATVPGAMDPVVGTSNTVSAILDKATGDFVVQGMVKSFKFKSPLMEEHYNENYMESDKLPKTTFKGKIVGFDGKNGTYDVEGDLTIHGVTNKVKTKVTVSNAGGSVTVSGTFTVKLNDYKLEVPAMAKKTLAETAKISIKLELEDKK